MHSSLDDDLDSKPSAKKEEADSVISKKPPPKGIKVEDGTRPTTEIKGLDMKRREYCALSKQISQSFFVGFWQLELTSL